MQSANHPVYTYNSRGKLINYTPSGGTNDVVADHVLLDKRLKGPRSVTKGGLVPTVLNSPHLFTMPLSMTSPPIPRPKTIASLAGYSMFNESPEVKDIYGITSAAPILTQNNQPYSGSTPNNIVGQFSSKHRNRF